MPDDEDSSPDDPANLRGLLKERTKERDHLRDQVARGVEAERKIAIYEAGITDPKTVKLLLKAHEGEWDAEAIKATASEYGLGQAPPAASGDEEREARQQAMADIAPVASGTRGLSDTRKPAANDDEALHEEILDLMAKHIDPKGRVRDERTYKAEMDKLMIRYGVKGSTFPA